MRLLGGEKILAIGKAELLRQARRGPASISGEYKEAKDRQNIILWPYHDDALEKVIRVFTELRHLLGSWNLVIVSVDAYLTSNMDMRRMLEIAKRYLPIIVKPGLSLPEYYAELCRAKIFLDTMPDSSDAEACGCWIVSCTVEWERTYMQLLNTV